MKNTFLKVVCSMLFAWSAQAQQGNFAGVWKLNLPKSFLAVDHEPSDYSIVKTITQADGKVTINDRTMNTDFANTRYSASSFTAEYITDGVERDIKVAGAVPLVPTLPAKVKAEWQGTSLGITERGVGPLYSVVGEAHLRYFLSQDGSQLILMVTRQATYFDFDQRFVFDREQPK